MSATWSVVCTEYRTTHKTKANAEARLEAIVAAGHCSSEHHIEGPDEAKS